jgi:hypothetical protein
LFNAADGDPQWWFDIRSAISDESARNLLESIMENDEAPLPNDDAPPWPSATRHTIDRERDAELARVLSKTEILIADFYKSGHLTLRRGQKLLDMLRQPEFDIKDIRSDTIIHLLRRLERPFKESAVQVYNPRKEKDGNQRLKLAVRDFRETFIEIMQNPEWAQYCNWRACDGFDKMLGSRPVPSNGKNFA